MDWKAGQVTPFAFKRTGDGDFPSHIKALVIGSPKSGKTTFISTFPNVVVADVEAGLMSIAHKNVPYVTIDKVEKLQTLLFVLRDDAMRAKAAEQMGLEKIESVAIDTMDALQELFKKERLAAERRTQFEMKDWGWLLDQFRELIRGFVSLPLHVIFTVHTKTVHVDEQRTVTHPGLQGAIAEEIAGMVGFSMMTHRTREVDAQTGQPYTQYRLQVEGDDQNPHLGNRAMGRLIGFIEPDFAVLHKAIYDGLRLDQQREGRVDMDAGSEVEVAPEPAQEPTPKPGNAPPGDDEPVNSAALQHIERMLSEWGFVMPDTSSTWDMGFARMIGRMFVATKDDLANGKIEGGEDEAKRNLRTFLEDIDAYQDPVATPPTTGTVPELIKWVGDDLERAQVALSRERAGQGRRTAVDQLTALLRKHGVEVAAPNAPEPSTEVAQETGQQSRDDEEFEKVLTEELDATLVEDEPAPEPASEPEPEPEPEPEAPAEMNKNDLMRIEKLEDAPPCEASGDPIDDLDIAKLSLSRFGKWLSVSAYIAETKNAKA